jgi:hypothetical protein
MAKGGWQTMKKLAVTLCALAMLVPGCARDVKTAERGESGASRKVLIAAVESDFKRKVMDKAVETLGTKDYYFKIVGLDQLAKEDTAPYGAIVLVGTFMAGRLDGRIMDYAANNQADPRLIVFYTQGAEGPPATGVRSAVKGDVITSASSADRVAPKAEELAGLIRKRFE